MKQYNGNKDKVFRICSLKYHPDRNIGNEMKANENQKVLLEIYKNIQNKITFFIDTNYFLLEISLEGVHKFIRDNNWTTFYGLS